MKTGKLLAIFLMICILFNLFPVYTIALSTNSKMNHSLHFMITHWHDISDSLLVEGYIVPNENHQYDFYLMNPDTQEVIELTDDMINLMSYIESIDRESGSITLSIQPEYDENGTAVERFSGFSISAGHSAIHSDSSNRSIQISYRSNVHLVKAYVFYSSEGITVFGSGKDDAVFGTSEFQNNLEQDTSWVYTYTKDGNGYKKGDVVKDAKGNPVFKKEDLPTTLIEGVEVIKTKLYSTLAGLHTDKTATAIDDRTFQLDLESWFSGAPIADIGLVLDSSGSMSFSSDELTPININDLELTEEQREKLMAKILDKTKYQNNPTTEEWEKNIFLTKEEVNEILDIYNTDDSKLSASDYTYYVFDERDSVNEYVSLGYWDGSIKNIKESIIGYYEFNKGNSKDPKERDWLLNSATGNSATLVNQIKSGEKISFQEAPLPQNWTEDTRIKMNTNTGLTIKNIENGVGVLLDAVPTSGNFTISFSITKDKETFDNTELQNYTDILYIGEINNQENSNYFRAIRDGINKGSVEEQSNSSPSLKGYHNEVNNSNKVADLKDVFSNTDTHTITLVFHDGKLSTYIDGKLEEANKDIEVSLSDYHIIVNGFNNSYHGADLFIDNIIVFNTVLNETEVQNINSIMEGSTEYIVYNQYNTNGNAESIGLVPSDFVELTKGLPGWYYITYDSRWEEEYNNEEIQSCKKFWGISGHNDLSFKDVVALPSTNEIKNTEYTYNPEKNTPTQFYIDEDGYLRCFFASGTQPKNVGTSFVYFKKDSQYIKTESLQRAIGNFARKLNDVSPYSQISAVRFSTDKIPDQDLDKLVLLDWTNNLFAIQNMMSLNYGTKGTVEGTLSHPTSQENSPIYQYNYGLTGGTATYTGLKSFYENLYTRANQETDKYLIIFTDGKDSTKDEKKQESITIANNLKDAGYTIFAVMLTGGSVEESNDASSEYQQAKKFLLNLVGTSNLTENKEDYFFSTLQGEKSIDSLTEIFSNQILKRITYNLLPYHVKDYIDPRFDLVSSDGNIYHLNADGNVILKNKEGAVIEQYNIKANPLSITLSDNYIVEEEARIAKLYYDNNMYYLLWENQIIPGCSINAKRLPVWNAQVTIKAKEDFIGGNAVLTNGNLAQMNFVYSEGDMDCSSGTEDVYIEDVDANPSKGFPRVTVNVGSSENSLTETKRIYMGETINNDEFSKNLLEDAYEKLKNTDLYYYIEYLERYALSKGEELKNYQEDIMAGNKLKISYYYLRNAENSNQTGSVQHENDLLGYIEYELVPILKEDKKKEIVLQDTNNREMVLTIKYIPLTIDSIAGQEENSRKAENAKLITDTVYLWNSEYKPDVGNKTDQKKVVMNHVIQSVSGEIALKVVFNQEVQKAIGNKQVTYQIDLIRQYEETSKKVGTFKAVYDKNNLPKPDENGNIILLAKITYENENDYMSDYGLPIGTYTVENPMIVTDANVTFDEPSVIEEDSLYTAELFTQGKDLTNIQDYIASFEDKNAIVLGALQKEKDYTDYRYGLLEVIASTVSEPEIPDPEPEIPDPEPEIPDPEPEIPDPEPEISDPTQEPQNPIPTPEEPIPDKENLPSRLPDTGDDINCITVLWGLTIICIITTMMTKIYMIREEKKSKSRKNK